MLKYFAIAITIMFAALLLYGMLVPPPKPDLGSADYSNQSTKICPKGTRIGASGFTDDLKSKLGTHYNVRTPINYDATRAHPLLMVYSPGDRGGLGTERFTRLTTKATKAGFIVAYADNRPRTTPSTHRPIAKKWITELGTIPALIAKIWCIDADRIFLSGHSNGGTATTALTILPNSPIDAAALVISGAGWTRENFDKYSCPKPRPVMIMHSVDDKTFPGFGPHSAKFWSGCNQCKPKPTRRSDGCMVYKGCTAATLYCEGQGRHVIWPKRNDAIIDFLYKSAQKN